MLNEDTRLLPRAVAGRCRGAERTARAIQPRLYFYCLKMLKDERRAQDTERKIFCEVLNGLSELKNDEDFPLRTVSTAARLCRAAQGTPRPSRPTPRRLSTARRGVLPDKALDSEENRCLAAALTAALPDVQRECVLMYYYLEMSISEIAAALAISAR